MGQTTANEIYSKGWQIEDRLRHDIGDPREWTYRCLEGGLVDIAGNKMKLDEEELDEEELDEEPDRVFWMIDFLCDGWFHDDECKKFVQSADPTNGLICFAELGNKLELHIRDFVEDRYLYGDVQTNLRIERHERLLVLSRWLQLLGTKPDIAYSCIGGKSYREFRHCDKSTQKQSDEELFVETEDKLSGLSLKLFRFLKGPKFATNYNKLRSEVWEKEVEDSSIKTGIERLASNLNKMKPQYFCIINEYSARRVRLDKLTSRD